jgi:glutaminyl-tRNA synthetase
VDRVDLAHHPELVKSLTDRGLPFEAGKPRQIEFSRLNLNYTVMSKRKLMTLVDEGLVDGWGDPRMPTLQGIRRRGYTADALKLFVARLGLSKQNSLIDYSVLENTLREDLDSRAPRRMATLDPLKFVITNLPEGHEEQLTFSNHPKDESFGQRTVPFSRELWIEREDFAEVPPKGWKRLIPGGEVRLRGAGIARCDEVIKNDAGAPAWPAQTARSRARSTGSAPRMRCRRKYACTTGCSPCRIRIRMMTARPIAII